MSTFKLRMRCTFKSNLPVIDFLTPSTTLENLYQVMSSIIEIHEDQFKILGGYPPKILQGMKSSQLQEVGVRNGDVLVIEKRIATDASQYSFSQYSMPSETITSEKKLISGECKKEPSGDAATQRGHANTSSVTGSLMTNSVAFNSNIQGSDIQSTKKKPDDKRDQESMNFYDLHEKVSKDSSRPKANKRSASGSMKEESSPRGILLTSDCSVGVLQKLTVPSDNSCLFTSMDYVLTGSTRSDRVQKLRQLVSQAILTETSLISDDVLDRPRQEYSSWILRDQSWGGEIELALLSNHYRVEIVAVDARTGRYNRFGESEYYAVRVFLLYDGIHYDPLHMESTTIEGFFYTSFPCSLASLLHQAAEIAGEAYKSGSYTDTEKFTLQCKQCLLKLKGEAEVLQHAKSTGHSGFEEVKA